MAYKEIIEGYKKKYSDDLSDLNEKQIERIAAFAYDSGHPYGIDECINFMSDYVDFARDVLKAQTK